MSDALPEFRYHPDPLATGFFRASDATCASCGRARGFVYTGPVYAVEELDNSLCPWCIADGSAAERFDAQFTDDVAVPADVPSDVIDIIATRTPGFSGWQQEHWMYHCADGMAFIGVVGWQELQDHPDALDSLRGDLARVGTPASGIETYLQALDRDDSPAAYLFRCHHCTAHTAFWDAD